MNFNIYNIIIIAGILQGFIFVAVVLCSKKYQSKSTLFLTGLIFCYSASILIYILPDIGLISLTEAYRYLFLPFASIIPVLIYFYVIYFLNPSYKFSLTDKLLFLPFVLFLSVFIAYKAFILFGIEAMETITSTFKFWIYFNEIFSVFYSIVLIGILMVKVFKYGASKEKFDLKFIRPGLTWLKTMLIFIYVFVFVWGYLTYVNIFTSSIKENHFYYLWIPMAVTIYLFGHIGVYKHGIIKERLKIRNYINTNEKNDKKASHTNQNIKDFENYLINEKAYLDSNLSLESVADHLKLSPSYLSRIIHSHLDTSFSDYVHSLRAKEAQNYLSNPEFSKYTMVAIGLEAGFNSRSAFFNIFKKETGKTPFQYKKEYLKNDL
ncbi:helix-turn-helix transcriptional regulator [Flavobacteriaceae bacterium SZ-1-7]|uniref:helix-turn-helix domain-containing protein n=1 Tax=Tamlana sedimenti TaxID=3134126 RepID=UPI003120ECAF